MNILDPSKPWNLVDAHGEYEIPIVLPGDIHSALIEQGLMDDPYFGTNEDRSQWVADRDWTFTQTVNIQDVTKPWMLEVSDVDTVAQFFVNEQQVLSTENSFRRYSVDVSSALQEGENTVLIKLLSATERAADINSQQPFPVPYNEGNCTIAHGNMLRKVQCDFGWDWGIALCPVGIYSAPKLYPAAPIQIQDLSVEQHHLADGSVELQLQLHLHCLESTDTRISAKLMDASEETSAHFPHGQSSVSLCLTLENPPLWWPSGFGEQILLPLEIQVGDTTHQVNVGLVDISVSHAADDHGHEFCFLVNGLRWYARGANWIPADALPTGCTNERITSLLEDAVAANMNMIRVWGGGRYESTHFYDECDRLGILVWQDFMFSCNLYPSTDEFLAEVAAEVSHQAKRLSVHPSIALWCGDNELVGALDWYGEAIDNRDRYLASYDRLNRTIETALKAELPNANWWPSSPAVDRLHFGDGWHDDRSGDMHFWSVWHEGRDFDHYRDVKPRFCSEFGFQSFPSLDLMSTFANEQDLNISSPVMEAHQKNAGGNARITETLTRYFRFPKNFEQLGGYAW